MGSLPHADSMEIAATANRICFTNCRGFTMNLQITQVITIGIIQGFGTAISRQPTGMVGFLSFGPPIAIAMGSSDDGGDQPAGGKVRNTLAIESLIICSVELFLLRALEIEPRQMSCPLARSMMSMMTVLS